MKVVFVDANVFMRFFTKDDKGQHMRAVALFERAAAGEISLVTGPPVLFEIAWTLRSAYHQPKERILDALSALIALPGLRLTDAGLAEKAIDLARASGQEFTDAYIVAVALQTGADEIATFNRKHFKKMAAELHAL